MGKTIKEIFEPKEPLELLERGLLPWLLCVTFITTAPLFFYLPIWLSIFILGVIAWRAVLWHKNLRLPPSYVYWPIVIIGIIAIRWHFHTFFGKEVSVALLALFVSVKLMEVRTKRDAIVCIMLGFFIVLTHYLFTQNIFIAILLFIFVTVLTATLLRLYGGQQPVRDLLKQASVIVAQAIPILVVFFLLFPRLPGPLWSMPRDASGKTGLSTEMTPGMIAKLVQSNEIALRVKFSGEIPDPSRLYWRGPVLDLFDGKTWFSYDTVRPMRRPNIQERGESVTYEVTLEANNEPWLLALDYPVKLPEESFLTSNMQLNRSRPVDQRLRYTVTSSLDAAAGIDESREMQLRNRFVPTSFNPQAQALAKEWKNNIKDPEKISQQILIFFAKNYFTYTLEPPLLGRNSIDDFLFKTRQGFCEHFAAAYVFLMRSAGIPARVVTGYLGGELNPIDNYFIVRQMDAHAWAEFWVEGKGWIRVDPTSIVSNIRIEGGLRAAMPDSEQLPFLERLNNETLLYLRDRWDAVNNSWNQWVIGYSADRQNDFLNSLGFSKPNWRTLIIILISLCMIILFAIFFWAMRNRPKPVAPNIKAWLNFCTQLEKIGIFRDIWEGPMDFAKRVSKQYPELAPTVKEAAEHFIRGQYSKEEDFSEKINSCTEQLKHQKISARTQV